MTDGKERRGVGLMRSLAALALLGCLALAGCAGGGGKASPQEERAVLFIPPAGREAPRPVLDIRAQRVGVIPAGAGEARADCILRLSGEDGPFADVFVYGAQYMIEAATIGGARAYRVESRGLIDGRRHGTLAYAFPNGMVFDVYDGPTPDLRHEERKRDHLELYWATGREQTPRRTLIGRDRLRELIVGEPPQTPSLYRNWSRLKRQTARYLGGERVDDDWYRLTFADAGGKTFRLPLPGSRKMLLPLLAALKDRPISLVRGQGRLDAEGRQYQGPLLYGVSALVPEPTPEPPPESAGEQTEEGDAAGGSEE